MEAVHGEGDESLGAGGDDGAVVLGGGSGLTGTALSAPGFDFGADKSGGILSLHLDPMLEPG